MMAFLRRFFHQPEDPPEWATPEEPRITMFENDDDPEQKSRIKERITTQERRLMALQLEAYRRLRRPHL